MGRLLTISTLRLRWALGLIEGPSVCGTKSDTESCVTRAARTPPCGCAQATPVARRPLGERVFRGTQPVLTVVAP